jgi:hypothetical protein
VYCPQCKTEYRAGFDRCGDCDVALVPELQRPEPAPDAELVSVLRTSDAALIPLVESVLDDAGIPFLIRNERVNAFMPGAGTPFGPAEFWVNRSDEAGAAELLAHLSDPLPAESEEPGE